MTFVQLGMRVLHKTFIMKKIIVLILLILTFCYGCKSQEVEDKTLSNPDNFSNNTNKQDYNSYLNHLARQEQLKTIKVLYNNKIYKYEKFKSKIGFKDNLNIDIIKDSTLISKYDVKNCKILFIVKDK